jgi:hypothetical protein
MLAIWGIPEVALPRVLNLLRILGVLCRKGNAVRVSVDHKPHEEEERVNALGKWFEKHPKLICKVGISQMTARDV